MDRNLIEEKIESLRRCVKRIESRRPVDVSALQTDQDLQDIIALNLTRSVQVCVDIAAHLIAEAEVPAPATMGEAFDLLAAVKVIDGDLAYRMKMAVGFRNVAVHNYRRIDWNIVHAICWKNLDDFSGFARAVSILIEQESND
jgi:uncharacterized protein YutE (UPF0331/DUF86 family)